MSLMNLHKTLPHHSGTCNSFKGTKFQVATIFTRQVMMYEVIQLKRLLDTFMYLLRICAGDPGRKFDSTLIESKVEDSIVFTNEQSEL